MSKEIEKYSKAEKQFIAEVKRIIAFARGAAYRAANIMQITSNWMVGKRIVEQEQNGAYRADYGKRVIEMLSVELTGDYGEGYSATNLRNMRKFYLTFGNLEIQQTLPAEFRALVDKNQQTASQKSEEVKKSATALQKFVTPAERLINYLSFSHLREIMTQTIRICLSALISCNCLIKQLWKIS